MNAAEKIVPSHDEVPEITRRSGPATYRQVDNLHVVTLEGTAYEMGRQHGALLAEHVATGPVPYYSTYIKKVMRGGGLGRFAPVGARLLRRGVGKRVEKSLPGFAKDTIRGMADGAGLSYRDLMDGCVMPDSLLWVAAKMMKVKRISPAIKHRLALGLGCSSAIAWGDATGDGRLLHARNLDYHGVDVWPRCGSVMFHTPDTGHRYVSVTAAGVPMGGVTAMNDAGLTLTVHQHMFSDGTKLGGTPIGCVGDLIMRNASNLDEAEAILRSHRPIGCWTYLIADGNAREVLCFEENPERQAAIRTSPEDSSFAYANIYLDAQLGATERDLYGSYWRHNLGRHERLHALLTERHGSLDADGMAAILGDVGDSECRIHKSIAMLMTVASVVFRPEDGVLWVATGEAPVSHNAFAAFSFDKVGPAPEHGTLVGGIPRDRPAAEAFDAYCKAYVAYFDGDDLGASRDWMRSACSAQPDQSLYHAVSGYLSVVAADPDAARASLDRAIELGHPDEQRLAAFQLWRGRVADLSSKRDEARTYYGRALEHAADAPVHKAATRGLRRRFTPRAARNISVDFAFADVLSP